MSVRWIPLQILLVILSLQTVAASAGDRDGQFISCVRKCQESSPYCVGSQSLPWSLWCLGWTCSDNCKYECMHHITAQLIQNHQRIYQYYGKWPFYRWGGIQEPASVVFSLLNFWAHYRGWKWVTKRVPFNYELRPFIVMFPFIGMNLWVWSTVFHSRDKPWTERLDYFSAMLYVVYNTFLAIIRIFGLVPTRSTFYSPEKRRLDITRYLVMIILGVFYLCHISYLSFWSFDYTYNMMANVSVGLVCNTLWIVWCIRQYTLYGAQGRYALKQILMITLLTLSMALELLDFEPFWLTFDAHSIWHLSTVPITFIYYDFLVSDAQFVYRQRKGKYSVT